MLDESNVTGATDSPLVRSTIGEALRETATQQGEAPAILSPEGPAGDLSYRALYEQTGILAAALLGRGLRPGDRVAILAPNCTEWALMQFATARAGLILVTLNPAYRSEELGFALEKVGCRMLVSTRRFKGSDYLAILGLSEGGPLPRPLEFLVGIGEDWPEGVIRFDSLLTPPDAGAMAALAAVEPTLGPDDAINIQFTSGTTGLPKAVTLSHFNILNNARFVADRQALGPDDRLCIPVPLYHCFGMVMGNLACITRGAAWIYPSPGFDAERTLDAVEQRRCTALYGVPTMFIAMLNDPTFAGRDLSSLRTGVMAGSPCPAAVMQQVIERMHMADVTICYGMTETSPVSFQTVPDDAFERRIGSVGRIHPHLEARIVGPDGQTCKIGAEGEIRVRGYSVMSGYWGDAEATAKVITPDGWMCTGDLGRMDAEGYCMITGRSKDIIIRGGENISPREIEELLHRHPSIRDAHVFGISNERMGEEICAWVLPAPGTDLTPEDVQEYCRAHIAHFKVPRQVRIVDSFPMTASGKVQKFLMRQQEEKQTA
ncbi:AMP-binding protein [Tropicimonas sp. IMCC34043]|uniref:AMP-binding protein n=1 Tax=Tropicimonas sp. IMCC34043 TaxID=2248760 RepID=UPI000E271427|nr:AMP-binding protein [Tropicimonas sp. IMCC34043]